jgi:diguanylate cyclase (GGDEF)-like protein
VAQVQDITDRKRYEQQLHYLADHDALTGIYNRRRFEEELDRAVAHARRFCETAAVLVIDLDNFKYVNDTYGHAVGDELLGKVAGALKDRLRTTDVLARLGGDEFAAILPRVCADAARSAAEHLLSAVRAEGHVLTGERKVRATCSIGINSIDPTTRLTAEELLVEADLAMFEAKEAGRDRIASVAPGEASRAKMKARMTWSERIRDALEHDHFELWEQPILTLATGSVDRAEVLVRMLDASGEAIAPGVFLYIAERFGQIQAVDRWVISRAIRLLAERGRILEVNLSGASITDEATIDFIAAEIRNAPIDPTQLVFEVTETTAIVNVERARRFARRLADLGCQFALDDFGSGFGSFYYLKHLPFDCVKIDGDFVKELPASPADQLTVKAIVQIARGLGKETVAEFVQDDRSVQMLRDYGVDYAQGYHIGRPRQATEGRRPAPLGFRV